MSIRFRILLSTLLTAIITALILASVIGWTSVTKSKAALYQKSQERLLASKEQSANAITRYFKTIDEQLRLLSSNPFTVQAALDFSNAYQRYSSQTNYNNNDTQYSVSGYYQTHFANQFEENNSKPANTSQMLNGFSDTTWALQQDFISASPYPLGGKDELVSLNNNTDYDQVHQTYHPWLREFQQTFNFYDVFLVDAQSGNLTYSVFKELDFATNLFNGPYADSGIGQAFQKGVGLESGQTILTDFAPYLPSYNAAASFIAAPIVSQGNTVAVLIFQMPIDVINQIMTHEQKWLEQGFGESGETYLVGPDNKLRSESRFYLEDPNGFLSALKRNGQTQLAKEIELKSSGVGIQTINSAGVRAALNGKSGFSVIQDYRGVDVLSAYQPLTVLGLNWAILSEVDEEEAFRSADELGSEIIITTLSIVILVLVISGFAANMVANQISSPLKALGNSFKEIASGDGDLTRTIPNSKVKEVNVIANAFNTFTGQVRDIVSHVKNSSNVLASASTELSAAIEESNQISIQQRDEIHHIVSAMEEFSVAILEVANNSEQSSSKTKESNSFISDNSEKAQMASSNIGELVDEVTQSAQTIIRLQNEVQGINEVLDEINGIADQTNLLALNAAIEAARAGEHGRGFSVVADEVRSLAARTQQSTIQIQHKIGELNNAAGQSVDSMKRASNSAEGGIQLVNHVSDTLTNLSAGISELTLMNETVATATQQQRSTADAINESMNSITMNAEQLQNSSNEISSSAASLAELASNMQMKVDKFHA